MKVLIIDNGSRHIHSLSQLLSKYSYDVIAKEDILKQNISHYNAIILSGSHAHGVIKHADLYIDEVALIKQTEIPLFGICIGFELMIQCFGGELVDLPKKIRKIETLQYISDPIFDGVSELLVYEAHRWLVKSLPADFTALAHSETGVEILKHKTRLMYGVQFHPEAYPESTNGYKILQNFLKIVEANMRR